MVMLVCGNCNNPKHVHKDQTEVDKNINIMINKNKTKPLANALEYCHS